MPLPPLAASERRLATVAAVSSWVCTFLGLAFALAPRLCLRALLLGGYAQPAIATRLFAALAGAGLLAIAASLRRAAASPREQRGAFAPLLWITAASAASLFLFHRRGDAFGISARPLGFVALACAAVFVVAAFVYFRAAPGVNLGAALPLPVEATPKAVQLGVRVAPAPEPLPVEPKAAAGASRG